MEYDPFLDTIADNLNWLLYYYPDFVAFLKDPSLVSLNEFADHLVMTLPSPRIDWYQKSSYQSM